MSLPRRTRRRVDALIAAGIAVVVATAGFFVWRGSDIRALSHTVAVETAVPPTPTAPTSPPTTLTERWRLPTDPNLGAVASVYGTVVTTSEHAVTGHDATTGEELWSYARSNRPLCAIGSGDTSAEPLDSWSGVHGILALYAKNGWCSQVSLFAPADGEILYQRTSPNPRQGALFFGKPYVGWLGSDYLELWRHDLVATIRYGNQPNPVKSSGRHAGCQFLDAAVTKNQLATIEQCDGPDSPVNLVLNWPTPGDSDVGKEKGWDANHSKPKATIGTGSTAALIVGLTEDRAAVLVSQPAPAVVTYDTSGTELARVPVDVSAAEVEATAAAGMTPSVMYESRRYSLVGRHLISVSHESVSVPAPPDDDASDGEQSEGEPEGDDSSADADEASDGSGGGSTDSGDDEPEMVTQQNPIVDWVAPDVIGLPTRTGPNMLIPTDTGLAVYTVEGGSHLRDITVTRDGDPSRVDVTAIGPMIVEIRGDTVVGLAQGFA